MNEFNLPLFMSIGEGKIEHIVDILEVEFENFDKLKIAFFTSELILQRFRAQLDKIVNEMENIHLYFIEDSTYDIAVEYAKDVTINDYDLIIGFGGGKVLDVAKYIAHVSKKKYITIPTVLSNDGLASPISVLKTYNGKAKSFGSKSPDGIIVDIKVIKEAPIDLLMAGIGDTVSNYTALYDWKIESKYKQGRINDFAYLLSDSALNLVLYSREEQIKESKFIYQLAQSLILSGHAMCIAGNSRPCSGSEHLFSHSLDENFELNILHGLQVALGSVVSCIFQGRDYTPIVRFLKRYNVDVSPLRLGITKEIFVEAWLKAKSSRPDRFSVLNIIDINSKNLEDIYDEITEVLQ